MGVVMGMYKIEKNLVFESVSIKEGAGRRKSPQSGPPGGPAMHTPLWSRVRALWGGALPRACKGGAWLSSG
jgi:hypothetical protein